MRLASMFLFLLTVSFSAHAEEKDMTNFCLADSRGSIGITPNEPSIPSALSAIVDGMNEGKFFSSNSYSVTIQRERPEGAQAERDYIRPSKIAVFPEGRRTNSRYRDQCYVLATDRVKLSGGGALIIHKIPTKPSGE